MARLSYLGLSNCVGVFVFKVENECFIPQKKASLPYQGLSSCIRGKE